MTITADYAPNIDLGNGTTRTFAVNFPFGSPSELLVTLFNSATNANLSPAPVLNGAGTYDYTVTGTPNADTGIYPNGSVTFNNAPPSPLLAVRERTTAKRQNTSLTNNGPFPAKTVEGTFDRAEMQLQEQGAALARALKIPAADGVTSADLPASAARAGRDLTFDSSGAATVSGMTRAQLEQAVASFLTVEPSPSPLVVSLAAALAAGLTLGTANAAATGASAELLIDANYTLTANTVLTAPLIQFQRGKITTGSFTLTCNTPVAGVDDQQLFDVSGGGAVVLVSNVRLPAPWFGADVTGTTDASTKIGYSVTAAAASAAASGNVVTLDLVGAAYKLDHIPYAAGIRIQGNGGKIIPLSQATGRILANNIDNVDIRGVEFVQTAGYHYNPAIAVSGGGGAHVISDNKFTNVGFGALVQGATGTVTIRNNRGTQVGIYPRPSPLDPSGAGFAANFLVYGGFVRVETSNIVVFDGNYLKNATAASGCISDVTGGAGGISTFNCNGVSQTNNFILNAPGQGIGNAGYYQGQDVVGLLLAGTFSWSQLGRYYRVVGNHCEGSNQEGITFFGCGNITGSSNVTKNNRYASVEFWQSYIGAWGPNTYCEDKFAATGIAGGVGNGIGAVHCVESFGITFTGDAIERARQLGYRWAGSYDCHIRGVTIREYGFDDLNGSYEASGIWSGPGVSSSRANSHCSVAAISFQRTAQVNNAGGDFAAQDGTNTVVDLGGHTSVSGKVSYAGSPDAFLGVPLFRSQSATFSEYGTPSSPISRDFTGRGTVIGATAKNICALPVIHAGHQDLFEVWVVGTDDGNSAATFAERLTWLGDTSPTITARDVTVTGVPAARTYTIVGDVLELSYAAGTASVRVRGKIVADGSQYI